MMRIERRPRTTNRPTAIAELAFSIALALAIAAPSGAIEIEGVKFSDAIRLTGPSETRLRLNGVGLLRYRVVFRGYVAGLYLPPDVSGRDALGDVSRRLELSYFWSIRAEDFANAAMGLLESNIDKGALASLTDRIEILHDAYVDVEPGDRYSLTYQNGGDTELRLNNRLLASVPGADFADAYFGIWLGEKPLDASLRDALLDR